MHLACAGCLGLLFGAGFALLMPQIGLEYQPVERCIAAVLTALLASEVLSRAHHLFKRDQLRVNRAGGFLLGVGLCAAVAWLFFGFGRPKGPEMAELSTKIGRLAEVGPPVRLDGLPRATGWDLAALCALILIPVFRAHRLITASICPEHRVWADRWQQMAALAPEHGEALVRAVKAGDLERLSELTPPLQNAHYVVLELAQCPHCEACDSVRVLRRRLGQDQGGGERFDDTELLAPQAIARAQVQAIWAALEL